MFFVPTVVNMSAQANVWLLCLSTGNFDGLGTIRCEELAESCRRLNIRGHECFDHKDLQDGPLVVWSPALIAKLVAGFVGKHPMDRVITFDERGVSGHPNHIAVCAGIRDFCSANRHIAGYKLLTNRFGGNTREFWMPPLLLFSINAAGRQRPRLHQNRHKRCLAFVLGRVGKQWELIAASSCGSDIFSSFSQATHLQTLCSRFCPVLHLISIEINAVGSAILAS